MSVIKNGVFYPDEEPAQPKSNANFKQWSHNIQRIEHKGDLLQRHKQGKPNGEFIRAYPEESKLQFDKKTLREFGNKYND